jgi:hypothetical protein
MQHVPRITPYVTLRTYHDLFVINFVTIGTEPLISGGGDKGCYYYR